MTLSRIAAAIALTLGIALVAGYIAFGAAEPARAQNGPSGPMYWDRESGNGPPGPMYWDRQNGNGPPGPMYWDRQNGFAGPESYLNQFDQPDLGPEPMVEPDSQQ